MAASLRRRLVLLAGLAGSVSTVGRPGAQTASPGPKRVVTSFTILGDLAQQIGEGRVIVRPLAGPDRDLHGFEPRPSDLQAVGQADVMVINGLGLEGWAERVVKTAGFRGKAVVASKGVKVLRTGHKHGAGHAHSHAHGSFDPHAWQDVANAKLYATNIRDGLVAADPAQRAAYETATIRLLDRLDMLDREIRDLLAPIPRTQRRAVTSHEAFAYFADAYDIDMLAVSGTWRDSEPSARELAALAAQVKTQRIRALFLENGGGSAAIQALSRETGVRIGGRLYADALSAPDGEAASYIDMMRHNARAIAAALR